MEGTEARAVFTKPLDGPLVLIEDPDATEARVAFTKFLEADPALRKYTSRLVFHTKRDALLRGLFSKERRITKEHMERAIIWGKHQLELRRLLWPPDAGSPVEIVERKIMDALRKYGTLSDRGLAKACHLERPRSGGYEVYNRAMRALLYSHQIEIVGRTRKNKPAYGLGLEELEILKCESSPTNA
jgi:hypothetical protein